MSSRTIVATLALCLLSPPAAAQLILEARPQEEHTGPAALTLVSESLRVHIDHQFARTMLEQAYLNGGQHRLEGRALVRAGEGARVLGFAYWNGEARIVGEVFEKETARRIYEQTTGLGRDPGLLEQVGEGAFAFRVFPIEPSERKRVEVTLGQRLPRAGAQVEYRAVLALAAADVVIELEDDRPLARLRSPTHRLETETPGPGRLRIRARPLGQRKELVLRYEVGEKPLSVRAELHRDKGQDAYVAITMPTAARDVAVSAKDVTLVIDRSGSMAGEPMAAARAAARAVVERLGARDGVNVIAFDDRVESLFRTPQPVDDEHRRTALAFVDRTIEAGGTNLGLALESALAASPPAGKRPHIILFITDGQSAPAPVLEAARKDGGDARVFTIGIGAGVNKSLLSRLAAMKRGRFTFVPTPEAIGPQVERLFAQIEAPVLLGLSLEVLEGGRLASVYPRSLPDLAAGEELVVVARASGRGPLTVRLTGRTAGRQVTRVATIALPEEARRPWVGRLWAAARVDDLLEQLALESASKELEDEVVNLALAYNFVTPYTSFLAIPASEVPAELAGDLAAARQRKRQILATRKDAAALSRDEMPPGDPVLTVAAPADARQVTATFPFGLVKDLAWDGRTATWKTRFLVPKTVADGIYAAEVRVVLADGAIELSRVNYKIDSAAPDFEVETEAAPGGVRIVVRTGQPAREVIVALVGNPQVRLVLTPARGREVFSGVLALPAGPHELRVVVADVARNEATDVIRVVR
jgi:Ca-activated chloride channel family protein